MAIHSREFIDNHLKKSTSFLGGIWLILKIISQFVCSLGPHNWALTKLASIEQKVDIPDTHAGSEARLEAKVLK